MDHTAAHLLGPEGMQTWSRDWFPVRCYSTCSSVQSFHRLDHGTPSGGR